MSVETINQVNKEIARELDIDEEIIKKVNRFYWNSIRDAIRTADHTGIRVRGLGTFYTSRRKLWMKIDKILNEIRFFRQTKKKYLTTTPEEILEKKYELLRKYLKRRNELAQAYYAKEERIREYKRKKDDKANKTDN